MSDFLTRLAERSLGVAPVTRPELAPIFAPDVAPQREVAREPFVPARQAEPKHVGDDSPPQTLLREMPRPGSSARASTPALNAAWSHTETRTLTPAEDAEPIVINPQALLAPEISPLPYQSAGPAPQVGLDPAARPATPAPYFLRSNGSEAPRTNAVPPSVNITIGRVEVRAISQSTKPRPEAPRSQGLSLDQYLRERNQKRR
jgi:hypothetical protein